MSGVTYPRFAARRGRAGATTWWGKAWARAVEESAYGAGDLRAGGRLARAGSVGTITVDEGTLFAAVFDGDDAWTASAGLPLLSPRERDAFVEAVAAESGRIAALVAGDLPHALVEHAEEAGVELLPYGGELDAGCTCEHWVAPCPHALAVLVQVAWLLDADPFVLLTLRGMPREDLLSALHARTMASRDDPGSADPAPDGDGIDPVDLDTAVEAAQRAARMLAELEAGSEPRSCDPSARP